MDRTHGVATSCQFYGVNLVEASIGEVLKGGCQICFWCRDTEWATFNGIDPTSSDGDLGTTAVSNALEGNWFRFEAVG